MLCIAAAPASAAVSDDLDDWASDNGIAGDGNSESTAWQISNAVQLQNLAQTVNSAPTNNGTGKFFKLNRSIDLSSVCSASLVTSWNPIGKGCFYVSAVDHDVTYSFKGTFSGDNYTISKLYIDNTNPYRGLFGYTQDAEIKYLKLTNVQVTSNKWYVGGIVGFNEDTAITNCSVSGSVTGYYDIGGIAGYNDYGTITNCYATGSVRANNDGFSGGLVGYNYYGAITNCYATSSVDGNSYIGGLVGFNHAGTITNCYATGSINGNYNYVGGFVGDNDAGTITNCYATGSVDGNNNVGGFVGDNDAGTITNCYATGNVDGNNNVGGFVGNNEDFFYSEALISNSVALNRYVNGTTNVSRFAGLNGGILTDNYAWNGITNNGATFVGGGNNGNNASSSHVWANLTFYQSIFGADNITDIGSTAWNIITDTESVDWTLPYLKWQTVKPSQSLITDLKVLTTVTYDGNGATAGDVPTDSNSPYLSGSIVTVLNKGDLVKTGNTFGGWNTQANGDGTNYAVGEMFTITADTILYADWKTNITPAMVTITNVTFSGAAQSPVVVVTDGDAVLIKNTDYTLSGDTSNVSVGEYSITVTGIGKYCDSYTAAWNITKKTPEASDFILTPESAVYTGANLTTVVTAKFGGMGDISNITYNDLDNVSAAGTYTVKVNVTGGENYTAGTQVNAGNFTITAPSNPTNPPSHSGSGQDTGSGNYKEYDRSVTNGGLVTFGTSPIVISVDLPKGVSGSVVLVAESETSAPSGKNTVRVFDINVQNYPTGEAAIITFKMTVEDIEKAGYTPADICLYHCDDKGVWTKLPTTYVIKNGIVYYEAVTTDFSPFAIVYEVGSAKTDETIVVPTETATAEPKPSVTAVGPVQTTATAAPQATVSPMGLIGLVIGLGAAGLVFRRK